LEGEKKTVQGNALDGERMGPTLSMPWIAKETYRAKTWSAIERPFPGHAFRCERACPGKYLGERN